jgi:hypothetical protein
VGAVWLHPVRGGPMIGRDRGGDDLKWSLGASLRMACKRCRANALWRRMRGLLGPRGGVDSRPVAAVVAGFEALAAEARGDATWAVVGRPVAACADGAWRHWTARSDGVEADPGPSSEDREVVLGNQGK